MFVIKIWSLLVWNREMSSFKKRAKSVLDESHKFDSHHSDSTSQAKAQTQAQTQAQVQTQAEDQVEDQAQAQVQA